MATTAQKPSQPKVVQITPKSFALYGNILNAYNIIGMLPLKWTGGRLEVFESNPVWLVIRLALIWLHIAFVDVQWARSLLTKGLDTSQKMLFSLQATADTAMAANFFVLVRYPHLVATTINNLLRLSRRHGGFVVGDEGTGACRVIRVSLFICIFGPLSFAARVFKNPDHPRSLVSLALNPVEVGVGWKVACCVYQFYSLFAGSATLWMIVSPVTVFLRPLTRIIAVIKKLEYEDLVKEVNEISLLLTWFNCTFRHWTVVWEATFILLVVIDLNVAMKQQSVQALLVACSMATMMIYLYNSMGKVYEESKYIMNNALPQAWDAPWFKRKCRAYRAFRVNVGSFFFVDKGLVLTILSITIQSTANLILTLRKA